MARPMQLIGAGSPKEDIVARLMRVVLLIGLAAAWRPDAAAAQYSWSNFSASVGFGTGSARLGIGASYTALDPLYDFYFDDPLGLRLLRVVPPHVSQGVRPHPRSAKLFSCFGEPLPSSPPAIVLLALRLL